MICAEKAYLVSNTDGCEQASRYCQDKSTSPWAGFVLVGGTEDEARKPIFHVDFASVFQSTMGVASVSPLPWICVSCSLAGLFWSLTETLRKFLVITESLDVLPFGEWREERERLLFLGPEPNRYFGGRCVS